MKTIVDCVDENAARRGGDLCFRYLESGDVDGPRTELDCAQFRARVHGIAAELARAFQPGDRVMLLYPPGLDFVLGFFACLAAGVIAVPAFPPDVTALDRSIARLRAIARDCGASAVLTTSQLLEMAAGLLPLAPELEALRWLPTDLIPADADAFASIRPRLEPSQVAFLQYTSGSTGTPKGVVVTHDNLLQNQAVIRSYIAPPLDPHTVSWLPLYHDMGLIGTVLGPVYLASGCTLISPIAFLQRPARWLEAMSTFRGTMSAAPNFAYELCARKMTPEARAQLDLSAWEISFNGAEPVRAETLARFADAFAVSGLRRDTVRPVYGLAEATLIATGARKQSRVAPLFVDASELEQGRVRPARVDAPARALVGCGSAGAAHRLEIVEPRTRRRARAGEVGEIWLAGPSVARGYWNRPEDTERDFHARLEGEASDAATFLRTGDLGFVHEGELFIAGRAKDVIIVRGRTLHPHDLERAAEGAHAAVRAGCVVAFGVEANGEEGIVVVAEIDERRAPDAAALATMIHRAIADEIGIAPTAIALLKARSLPKTTSGKVQRSGCRDLYLQGRLQLAAEIVRAPQPAQGRAEDIERTLTSPLALARLTLAEREATLTKIVRAEIAQLLGRSVSEVDEDAPMHGLGLDSLQRIDLDQALEQALTTRLPHGLTFQHATPRALAMALRVAIDEAPVNPGAPAVPAVPATAGSSSTYRATANQTLMWRLQQHAPGAYMHVVALELRGDLGLDRARAALQAVVDRASIWRTTFHLDGDVLRARVHDALAANVEAIDASSWSEEELSRALERESSRGIDTARGPLLRGTLYRRAAETSVLVLAFNHLAYDSATWLRALGAILARLGGQAVSDAPGEDFAPYARLEEARLASPEAERWRAHARASLPRDDLRLEVPYDRPEVAPRSYACACVSASVPPLLVTRLEARCRAGGVTMSTALVTAYQAALHRATKRATIVVGTATQSRLRREDRRVDGPLFNHVPLALRFDPGATWSELLARAQAIANDAFAHQEHPFGHLAKDLGADTNRAGDAVFTLPAMFAYYALRSTSLGDPLRALALQGAASLGDLSARLLPIRTGTSATDYFLFATELDGALSLELWYASELIDRARATGLLQAVLDALRELCDAPDQPLREALS
jgi:acyl-CoA synthetase (AMP-forming)/AMP-acid ligase II/acyl carrier protein